MERLPAAMRGVRLGKLLVATVRPAISKNRVGNCDVGRQGTAWQTERFAQRPGDTSDRINGCLGETVERM